jgi:hypothetical protein
MSRGAHELCEPNFVTRRKSTGHRFSVKRTEAPALEAKAARTPPASTTAGRASRGRARSAARMPWSRHIPTRKAAPVSAATAANSGRVSPTTPAASPASTSRSWLSARSIRSMKRIPKVAELVCGSTKLKAVPENPMVVRIAAHSAAVRTGRRRRASA